MINIETASQVVWPRRLYGSAAAIVNAEPALQQAAQLLAALAWAPSQVLTAAAARLAVFAWFWVAAEAPALMVSAAKPCEESINTKPLSPLLPCLLPSLLCARYFPDIPRHAPAPQNKPKGELDPANRS